MNHKYFIHVDGVTHEDDFDMDTTQIDGFWVTTENEPQDFDPENLWLLWDGSRDIADYFPVVVTR